VTRRRGRRDPPAKINGIIPNDFGLLPTGNPLRWSGAGDVRQLPVLDPAADRAPSCPTSESE
jgi:hypothetical protein